MRMCSVRRFAMPLVTGLALVLLVTAPAVHGDLAVAQDAAPELPAAEAAPPASAIPKPAGPDDAPKAKPVKKAKKAVSCDGLYEAACKETANCAWQGGPPPAAGALPQPGNCVKVDKTAAKGTKESCPAMFEALCRETKGCDWTAGPAGADGKPGPSGCTYIGKAKKSAAAKPVATPPPPDTFGDQQ